MNRYTIYFAVYMIMLLFVLAIMMAPILGIDSHRVLSKNSDYAELSPIWKALYRRSSDNVYNGVVIAMGLGVSALLGLMMYNQVRLRRLCALKNADCEFNFIQFLKQDFPATPAQ
jgi:hypothetical protein